MANNKLYQLYPISEGRAIYRHVSDLTGVRSLKLREAWAGSRGSDERSSSGTFRTIPDSFYRPDTQVSRTHSSSSATLQHYNSLKKQTGGATIEKGQLPPAGRTRALVQIPVSKSEAIQKHGTRSLPNSSLQEVVEPLPRHATSATGRKDQSKQKTQTSKVPLPKINNLVKGELSSVTHNQEHGFRMPAGVPTTRNVVLLAGEKTTRNTPLATPLPGWLQEPRHEHQAVEKNKNELNRRADHPKPWLQTAPKKTQETGSSNKPSATATRIGVFHAPEVRQKTEEEDGQRKLENKDRNVKAPEKSPLVKRSKILEKGGDRKQSPRRGTEPHRNVVRQRTKIPEHRKDVQRKRVPDYITDTESSTDSVSSSSEDEGLFSFAKRKQAHDMTSPRRGEVQRSREKDKGPEVGKKQEEKKQYTIQDAVSVYKQDYLRTKRKQTLDRSRRRRPSPETNPRSQSKERILNRREVSIYQNMSKAYATDDVKRKRENQFYKRLLELQMKKWHEDYRKHLKRQLDQLDKQQEQESQLMRVRGKFVEEQLKRFRSQYITGRVVTHEWANRSEYGLPEDTYTDTILQASKLYRKVKPKKFSFKKQYLKNKKKFNTIFKSRALFVNEDIKPPKMEGIDTVELDGSGSRDVKDVLKEAEDLLDETDQDSDDFSSSDDESSAESFDGNVPVHAKSYKTTKPLPRRDQRLPEKKRKRVVVVPPPKKPTTDWKRKQHPTKSKGERSTNPPQTAEKVSAVSRDKTPSHTAPSKYKSTFINWKSSPSDRDDDSDEITPRELKTKPISTSDDVGEHNRRDQPSQKMDTRTEVDTESPEMVDPEGEVDQTKDDGQLGSGQSNGRTRSPDVGGIQEDPSPETGQATLPRSDQDSKRESVQEDDLKDDQDVIGPPDLTETKSTTNEQNLDPEVKGRNEKDTIVKPSRQTDSNSNASIVQSPDDKQGKSDGISGSKEQQVVKDNDGPKDAEKKSRDDNKEKRQPDPEHRTAPGRRDSKPEGQAADIKMEPVQIDPDKRLSPLNDNRTNAKTSHSDGDEVKSPDDKQTKSLKRQELDTEQTTPSRDGTHSKNKDLSEPKSGSSTAQHLDEKQERTAKTDDPPIILPGAEQTKVDTTSSTQPDIKGSKRANAEQKDDLPAKPEDVNDNKANKTDSKPKSAGARTDNRDTQPKLAGDKADRSKGLGSKIQEDDTQTKPRRVEQTKTGQADHHPSKSTDITQAKPGQKGGDTPKPGTNKQANREKAKDHKSHPGDEAKKPSNLPANSTSAKQAKLKQNDLPGKPAGAKRTESGKKDDSLPKTGGGKPSKKEDQRVEKNIPTIQKQPKGNDQRKKPKAENNKDTIGGSANTNEPSHETRGEEGRAQKPGSKRSKPLETTLGPPETNLNKQRDPNGKKETKRAKDDKSRRHGVSKARPTHENSSDRNNKQQTTKPPTTPTRDGPRGTRKSTRKSKKEKPKNDGTAARKPPSRSGKNKDDDNFNISSYLEDRKWPNVYDVRLSDDDSSDSDEDIFEKAMRKYGIHVDDSD